MTVCCNFKNWTKQRTSRRRRRRQWFGRHGAFFLVVTETSLKISSSLQELTNDLNYSVISFLGFNKTNDNLRMAVSFSLQFCNGIRELTLMAFAFLFVFALVPDKWLNSRKVKICKRGLTNLRIDINNEVSKPPRPWQPTMAGRRR